MATIHQDWLEFSSALLSQNTKFLLIGAHALAFHVEARLTEDLDVLVEPSLENARKVHAALVQFGFGSLIADPKELGEPGRVFMLGRKPIASTSSRASMVSRSTKLGRRASRRLSRDPAVHHRPGRPAQIGRDALLKNKRASGRKKDLVDVALLESEPDE